MICEALQLYRSAHIRSVNSYKVTKLGSLRKAEVIEWVASPMCYFLSLNVVIFTRGSSGCLSSNQAMTFFR